MIGEFEAVPEGSESIFETPEKRKKIKNMMSLGSVSGFVEDDEEANIEVLYEEAKSDDEGEDVDVAELDTEENRECLERVKRGIQSFQKIYWEVAQDIYNVNVKKLYLINGHKSFNEYVEKDLDFSRRKAHYFVNIFKYYTKTLKAKLQDKPDLYNQIIGQVKSIGWTKAERIAKKGVLDANNAEELFNKFTKKDARGQAPSVTAIEDIVAEVYHSKNEVDRLEADEDNEIEQKSMKFTWSKAQFNSVAEALEIAKGICSLNSKPSTHIAWVCAEFATNYVVERGKDIDLKMTMERFEQMLGVDIVVLDRTTHKVKYGSETAKAIKNSPE